MKQDSEDKLARVLEALEHPSSFTPEELDDLFSDKECLANARALLHAKEALAREHVARPDVDEEWGAFKRRRQRSSIIRFTVSMAAACVVLCVVLFSLTRDDGGVQVFKFDPVVQTVRQETINGITTIYVPRGMQKRIELPDGTSVTLNAESQLAYDMSRFGEKERSVSLKGEGLFDVAKDSLHPFIVRSDELSMQVLGTVFNIRNYATEQMKITLLSGALKVVPRRQADSLRMHPGEQAIWTGKQKLRAVKVAQTDDVTSWTEGDFYFDNQTLVEILCELGRWYNVNVIFKDKECMNNRLHFKAFRKEPLASVVGLLNYVSKEPIVLEEKNIIVGK